ncbi:MAG: hypothetical protein DRP09_00110 [Candidatus Thorarchaeota archaeon]|nr:MAG: hypothetical protein DRP09_00110 [Candidatus Thorarchaeota archaeon]
MSDEIMARKYEFFSRQGFLVGFMLAAASLIAQSIISPMLWPGDIPSVWTNHGLAYLLVTVFSSTVVGVASGGVLIFLFPPDQDVIGIAGMGSDDATQHFSLILIIMALIQPLLTNFLLFFDYFANDPLVPIWVILGFAAPSLGLTTAMFDRSRAIADDLKIYFTGHKSLDMASLDWLHGLGPRTATYRMGMLESAARRVPGLKISGHEIIKLEEQFAVNKM